MIIISIPIPRHYQYSNGLWRPEIFIYIPANAMHQILWACEICRAWIKDWKLSRHVIKFVLTLTKTDLTSIAITTLWYNFKFLLGCICQIKVGIVHVSTPKVFEMSNCYCIAGFYCEELITVWGSMLQY